jgi:hypothetical protein
MSKDDKAKLLAELNAAMDVKGPMSSITPKALEKKYRAGARYLDKWFTDLEAETVKLLEKRGGNPSLGPTDVFPIEDSECHVLSKAEKKALPKAERQRYERDFAIHHLQAALCKLRLGRIFALQGRISDAVRHAHESAIHGMHGAGKLYRMAADSAAGEGGGKEGSVDRVAAARKAEHFYDIFQSQAMTERPSRNKKEVAKAVLKRMNHFHALWKKGQSDKVLKGQAHAAQQREVVRFEREAPVGLGELFLMPIPRDRYGKDRTWRPPKNWEDIATYFRKKE